MLEVLQTYEYDLQVCETYVTQLRTVTMLRCVDGALAIPGAVEPRVGNLTRHVDDQRLPFPDAGRRQLTEPFDSFDRHERSHEDGDQLRSPSSFHVRT